METVNLTFYYGGKWEFGADLAYINGEAETIKNFDIDFLSYMHMIKMYKEDLGYINVTKLYALEPGKSLKDGLCLLEDDNSIRCMINYIRTTMGVKEVHIYAHHDVDQP